MSKKRTKKPAIYEKSISEIIPSQKIAIYLSIYKKIRKIENFDETIPAEVKNISEKLHTLVKKRYLKEEYAHDLFMDLFAQVTLNNEIGVNLHQSIVRKFMHNFPHGGKHRNYGLDFLICALRNELRNYTKHKYYSKQIVKFLNEHKIDGSDHLQLDLRKRKHRLDVGRMVTSLAALIAIDTFEPEEIRCLEELFPGISTMP